MRINLNADLGESFGPWPMGEDHRLIGVVNSANIACGFHAGDPVVMQNTIRDAKSQHISIGAHPGFPDLQGFGRRPMTLSKEQLTAAILYQLSALDGMCRASGADMTHVKPHGALNNMACEDRDMAECIAHTVVNFDHKLILLAPALSKLATAGQAAGLPVALEIFADRSYDESGSLTARSQPGAVIATATECIQHVLQMLEAGGLVTTSGKILPTTFHSICVHGDNAHAVDTAAAIKKALLKQQHWLQTLPELINS